MAKKKAKKTVSVETRPKAGQPTKFTEKIKVRIEVMTELGYTSLEMCKHLEITDQTLLNWRKIHTGFFGSLPDWRIGADAKVEAALYNSCLGGIVKEKKPQSVMVGDGMSTIEQHEQEKYIPPNVTAQKFWLTNRRATEWREKREFDINEVNKLTDKEIQEKALAIMAKAEK